MLDEQKETTGRKVALCHQESQQTWTQRGVGAMRSYGNVLEICIESVAVPFLVKALFGGDGSRLLGALWDVFQVVGLVS